MKLIALLVAISVCLLFTGCSDTPIAAVDESLMGSWYGHCEIGLPVVFDPTQLPANVERTQTTVDFELTIHEDATVQGRLGEATLQDCVLKQNRTDLGRALNLETDYIVIDGYLSGLIVSSQDEDEHKDFTIPFNLEDGRVQGSLMWLQAWKYPFPLCRVDLERKSPVDEAGLG
jgi:hypothetical protein